ncbi:ArnT family glycosyltransferase [Candidatus Poriferisodalis sp.]|uniref:ArnT family glycosyltransferase n=1 Tax=Candidatus Poriferisodalis sp. TaxID=3101277 RepID=UPI003D0D7E2D
MALLPLAVLALWLPDLDLPLGNSDDGRLVAFSGLHARNFWEMGPVESRLGARVDPYVRPEFDVAPRTDPPVEAVTYAHHPPLKEFLSIGSAGLLGENLPALRVPIFLLGAATLMFMASLLRACDLRWGPIMLAVGAMACTGFFYVYGRLGVSFSLLVASAASVAWLLKSERPSRTALLGTGVLAALAAMQSWIALAGLGLLAVWLFASHLQRSSDSRSGSARPLSAAWGRVRDGWSPALTAFTVGAAVGATITAAWMLYATGFTELSEQVGVRVGNQVTSGEQSIRFTFGEFLSRQWRFATEELLVPPWLRLLLIPALLAGSIDRRTRVPTAITLTVAAALTFGVQQGAWIHRLWNFPWLVPVTIGLAALLDGVRRKLPGCVRGAATVAAGAVLAITMFAVATGSTRDRYITNPAHLGEALEQVAISPEVARAELTWTGPGLPAPRWVSYYLDTPVWELDESRLEEIDDSDIVVVRASRVPDFFPADALTDPLASIGDFHVISAASLSQ